MATIVLQIAGAAIGAAIGGPVGATIGRAVGAAAGYAIDRKLFSKDQLVSGGRLENGLVLSAGEGSPVPRVYGRVQTGGQLIWATRFEEVRSVKKSGGKGGPATRTESYTYFGNFAVAICEGPITRIGRIWADGREIDRTSHEIRIHHGHVGQQPDPLIEALQGSGNAPAYRGTAYAVFEGFPLADYGNRIPQIRFEVIRSLGGADERIRSVCLIPGAGEHVYAPQPVVVSNRGENRTANRNVLVAHSDWEASLDELQAVCPNLESVTLVVSWFGNDLRCGDCRIEPAVTSREEGLAPWTVNGIDRSQAREVSRIDGRPAYGGTPDDASVIAAISDLRSRGLKVNLYPFILMDVPAGNGLEDPHGGNEQAAHPWRGRITCYPGPEMTGSADRTQLAAAQVAAFSGRLLPDDIVSGESTTICLKPQEFSLRRLAFHYARLAHLAGGVDGFIIASELVGLTRLRDDENGYPFVTELKQIAAGVRSITGPDTQITYAADWSEYHGHQPPEAPGDLRFPLDDLWADANIDAIGIDNYMPVTDWQQDGDPANPNEASHNALSLITAGIGGGEGYDWYYASEVDRLAGNRTPITDGHGQPWVWRYKDILSWWSNPHHERHGGVVLENATAWQPASKPIWMVEAGCPAVDRGANQPNVFIDVKSAESALPRFSRGGRDDLMQLRFVEAFASYWSMIGQEWPAHNPLSPVYGGPMVDPSRIGWWAWDARPFPAFPLLTGTWSDGDNWYRGHWLNGRLGTCPLDRLIEAIFADQGFDTPVIQADAHLQGYLVGGGEPLRNAIEPLVALFNLGSADIGGQLVFRSKAWSRKLVVPPMQVAEGSEQQQVQFERAGEDGLARELVVSHSPMLEQWEPATTSSRRLETGSRRIVSLELPAVMERGQAHALAEARLRDLWTGRDTLRLELPPRYLHLEPGDMLELQGMDAANYRIDRITDGATRLIEATAVALFEETIPHTVPAQPGVPVIGNGKPHFLLLDLPLPQGRADPLPALHCALFANPWNGTYSVSNSPSDTGFGQVAAIGEPATIGVLDAPLRPGFEGRIDHSNRIIVTLSTGELASVDMLQLLAGENPIAIRAINGEWEIIQFARAEPLGAKQWQLSTLLRGQAGSGPAANAGAAMGADVVVLDSALRRIELLPSQTGVELNWRAAPAGQLSDVSQQAQTQITCHNLAARPLSPVHLKARRSSDGSVNLTWIRRSRTDTGNWDHPDVPLDEPMERYHVTILSGETKIRSQEIVEPSFVYSAPERLTDLGSHDASFVFRVAQIARTGLPGASAQLLVMP